MALGIADVAAAQNAPGQIAGSGREDGLPGPRVSGRFVDTRGEPLADVAVTGGWRGLTGMGRQLWTPLGGLKADDLGRFVIELPSEAYLEFSAAPPGLARKRWSVQWLFPGTERELGDLVLEPEAVVTVWVVDAQGELLTQGWTIECISDAAYENSGDPHPLQRIYASWTPIDAARGSVRLTNLPAGHVHLVARGPQGVESNRINVDMLATKAEHVQLVYDGPDPRTFVTVDVRAPAPFAGDALWVRAADGTRRPLTLGVHSTGRLPTGGWSMQAWGALEGAGPWTLESNDPRLEVAIQPGLRPGASFTVELVGTAALAVTVVEADTGRPIDEPKIELLELWLLSGQEGSNLMTAAPEVSGRAHMDLVPGAYRISVSAATFAESELFVVLTADTARSERIELRRPVVYTGRVVDTDGVPVVGASVEVERGHVLAWSWSARNHKTLVTEAGSYSSKGPPFAMTRTNAQGRFELDGLAPGPLTFRIERSGFPADIVHATHAGSEEQVLRVPGPTRIEVQIDFPPEAKTPTLGVVLDAPEDPEQFAELDPEHLDIVPASSDEPGLMHAELLTTLRTCRVTLVRAEGTGESQRWIPVGGEGVEAEVGTRTKVRFDAHALLPATFRLRADATASPAVTSLRGAWLALGVQRVGESGESGEPWRRSRPAPLPPPPASLAAQSLTVSVAVPAGDYEPFAGGPGWRWIAPERLSCTLLESIDVAVDVDPPLAAREVQLAAEDGTPLASAGAQLWFEGIHPLPRGERLMPVSVLTDEWGRFRAVGPIGATLHARVVRDAEGAPVRARPAPTLDFEPTSDGAAIMSVGAEPLVLTVRTL